MKKQNTVKQNKSIFTKLASVLALMAFSQAFAQQPPPPAPESPSAPPPPPSAAAAAAESADAGMPAAVAAEETGDIDAQNVSISVTEGRIQDVLRSLAAMRPGTTMMIDPTVSGTASFELQNVPWEMAIQLVAEQNGLVISRRSENIFLVEPASGAAVVEKTEEIEVKLYTIEELDAMADYEVVEIFTKTKTGGAEAVTAERARAELKAQPGMFIKHLAVNDKPAVDVIEAIARKSKLDFVFSTHFTPKPAAQGGANAAPNAPQTAQSQLPPISLSISNQPLSTALKLIADQGGLSVTEQNGVWVVKPLRAEEIELEPLVRETFRVRYIPVDEKLQADVKGLLSDRGKLVTRGKIITVFDTAECIDKIARVIEDQDIPTPQVLIETRFFVLNNTDSDELGIDWTTLTTDSADGGGMDFSLTPDNDITWEYMKNNLVTDPDIHTATLSLPELNMVLRALKNNSKAEQLSNPKIIVSSDEQATIHIGRQEPIIKSSIDNSGDTPVVTYELDGDFGGETIQVTDLLADQGDQAATETSYTGYKGYLDLGTKLTVAPSVKTEDEVYIRVIPELINRPDEILLNLQTFPVLFRVRVQTEFTVRSGQTIAIGGLVSEDKITSEKKVPGLGSIPFLGRAFRYNSEEKVRSETIIFLTVKVLSSQEIDTTTGIPVRARSVQDTVDDIRIEDAAGAVYDEERVIREREERRKREEEAKLSNRIRRLFNPDWQHDSAEDIEDSEEAEAEAELDITDDNDDDLDAAVAEETDATEVDTATEKKGEPVDVMTVPEIDVEATEPVKVNEQAAE